MEEKNVINNENVKEEGLNNEEKKEETINKSEEVKDSTQKEKNSVTKKKRSSFKKVSINKDFYAVLIGTIILACLLLFMLKLNNSQDKRINDINSRITKSTEKIEATNEALANWVTDTQTRLDQIENSLEVAPEDEIIYEDINDKAVVYGELNGKQYDKEFVFVKVIENSANNTISFLTDKNNIITISFNTNKCYLYDADGILYMVLNNPTYERVDNIVVSNEMSEEDLKDLLKGLFKIIPEE